MENEYGDATFLNLQCEKLLVFCILWKFGMKIRGTFFKPRSQVYLISNGASGRLWGP